MRCVRHLAGLLSRMTSDWPELSMYKLTPLLRVFLNSGLVTNGFLVLFWRITGKQTSFIDHKENMTNLLLKWPAQIIICWKFSLIYCSFQILRNGFLSLHLCKKGGRTFTRLDSEVIFLNKNCRYFLWIFESHWGARCKCQGSPPNVLPNPLKLFAFQLLRKHKLFL